MFTVTAIGLSLALLGLKYGADDRPGFDERRPLN